MNSGFRGNRIGVTRLTLVGTTVECDIAFVDQDGVTHGTMRHSFPAEADEAIAGGVNALVMAVINKLSGIHFAQPEGSGPKDLAPKGSSYGIAEALGAAGAETDEPDGAQG